jgi:Ser/Thr protein kinase RdoA (MazF antagonist)
MLITPTQEMAAFAGEAVPGCRPADTSGGLPPHLLRIHGDDGHAYIVKSHNNPARFRREHIAYTTWTWVLGDQAPQLIAADPGRRMLLLSALPGAPIPDTGLSKDRERTIHQQAGRLLRRLHHHAEPLRRDTGICLFLAGRLRIWISRGRGLLTSAERATLRTLAAEIAQAGPVDITVCHLDFQPRNWLIHHRTVGLIDFEHTRIDVRIRDLARLAYRHWDERPDLHEAFMTGYGRHLNATDTALLHHFGAIEAITSLVRGRDTDDPDLLEHGRSLLARLG